MADQDAETGTVTAAMLVIGNEILSGRTQDANINFVATGLNEIGIQMREVRVVPDIEAEIVAAVNALRTKFDYVFTTGGIGPTHDDITAESVAAAFGRMPPTIQRPMPCSKQITRSLAGNSPKCASVWR